MPNHTDGGKQSTAGKMVNRYFAIANEFLLPAGKNGIRIEVTQRTASGVRRADDQQVLLADGVLQDVHELLQRIRLRRQMAGLMALNYLFGMVPVFLDGKKAARMTNFPIRSFFFCRHS